MGKSHKTLVTQIQADEKVMLANEHAISKVKDQLQCKCTHRDANGSFALIAPSGNHAKKSPYTNAPLYRCRICKKEIDISNIAEDTFNASLNCLDSLIDICKMYLNTDNEKDLDTLKKYSKLQYRMKQLLVDGYRTTRKGGKKKKNRNNPDGDLIYVDR